MNKAFAICCFLASTFAARADLIDEATYGYADNGDVKIHYATVGEGPLVVMIHGFPDFWYSWRHQMEGLKDDFKVVAIDQRGYNKSSKPVGVDNYAMPLLVSDIEAVIKHFGTEKAIVVGHDWGGVVAWSFAFSKPHLLEKLVILNLPHPRGIANVVANNPTARANTNYAQVFRQKPASDPTVFFGGPMNVDTLSGWVTDQAARVHYREAFARSDFDGMLNFYKANYPPPPAPGAPPAPVPPMVTVPVLIFHGLKDTALHSDGLNNTWDWVEQPVTIVTAPNAGHFVQQDAAELVTSTMKWWLGTVYLSN